MVPSITVRNLTATTLTLKRVEHFEDPNALQSKAGGFLFMSKNSTSAAPSAVRLGEHAESFEQEDVNVVLAPYESYTFRHASTTLSPTKTTLRLTIEDASASRHRIDTNPSHTQKSTQPFISLSAPSSPRYTGLFHPSTPAPHLSIRPHHQPTYYTQWMSTLPDPLPLSALSIPGTHNSHTHHRALPSVRCQTVDIATQLAHGIRFLDIRLSPDLSLVHGAFPVSLTGPKAFAPLLDTCYAFLAAHPSETLLVSLKREGVGSGSDEDFAEMLEERVFGKDREMWYVGSGIPCLGDVRGKIVLVRRFHIATTTDAYGIDATCWPHNAAHALFPTSPDHPVFCLQDFCDVDSQARIKEKLEYCIAHLGRAAACLNHIPGVTTDKTHPVPPGPLYLNFLSASCFWNGACWPGGIAAVVNRGVEEWMCRGHGQDGDGEGGVRRKGDGDGGTGVVVMDFVGEGGDWGLVEGVVGMNVGVVMGMEKMKMEGCN